MNLLEEDTPVCFLELPLELKRRVATFLETGDAVNVTKTCKNLHRNLSLTRLNPIRPVFSTVRKTGDSAGGNNWHRFFRIPVLNKRVHSLRLECIWRDQGWGNRKGECRIVAYPVGTEVPDEVQHTENLSEGSEFSSGRVVCQSGIAQHDEERLRFAFSPLDDEIYIFFYKVGGGGGHALFMRDCHLHTILFDDESRNWTNNYRILFEEGVLCRQVVMDQPHTPESTGLFFPRMLIRVSRALRRQLQEDFEMVNAEASLVPDDELEAFLAEYSIPLNLGSLVALEEIVQADIEERLVRKAELERAPAPPQNNMELVMNVQHAMRGIGGQFAHHGIPFGIVEGPNGENIIVPNLPHFGDEPSDEEEEEAQDEQGGEMETDD